MFSSDRVSAEFRERFQQLQNIAQRYAFLTPELILRMDELNLDQALQDINKAEFTLEHATNFRSAAGGEIPRYATALSSNIRETNNIKKYL
ncbi:UNVERIFIED_CONTAM: hypothetical protein NCL1_45629 [Trichonephila clavipes]